MKVARGHFRGGPIEVGAVPQGQGRRRRGRIGFRRGCSRRLHHRPALPRREVPHLVVPERRPAVQVVERHGRARALVACRRWRGPGRGSRRTRGWRTASRDDVARVHRLVAHQVPRVVSPRTRVRCQRPDGIWQRVPSRHEDRWTRPRVLPVPIRLDRRGQPVPSRVVQAARREGDRPG